jgi:aspartate ammonia-lyase
MVKKACTLANMNIGELTKEYDLHDEFIVDAFQGGAGTSTNMNVNEVIASRANEILGEPRNAMAPINANDHVNMSQSTNDVYPTATKIATIFGLSALSVNVETLVKVLEEKAEDFKDLLKLGRTEMQDAVPITLGQEFGAWAGPFKRDLHRIGWLA